MESTATSRVNVGANSVTGALATIGAASVAGIAPPSAETPIPCACAVRSVPSGMPRITVARRTSARLAPASSTGTVHRPSA